MVRGASCLAAKREGNAERFLQEETEGTEEGDFNTEVAVRLRRDYGATRRARRGWPQKGTKGGGDSGGWSQRAYRRDVRLGGLIDGMRGTGERLKGES